VNLYLRGTNLSFSSRLEVWLNSRVIDLLSGAFIIDFTTVTILLRYFVIVRRISSYSLHPLSTTSIQAPPSTSTEKPEPSAAVASDSKPTSQAVSSSTSSSTSSADPPDFDGPDMTYQEWETNDVTYKLTPETFQKTSRLKWTFTRNDGMQVEWFRSL